VGMDRHRAISRSAWRRGPHARGGMDRQARLRAPREGGGPHARGDGPTRPFSARRPCRLLLQASGRQSQVSRRLCV